MGRPSSTAGMLKQGEACLAPTKRDIRRWYPWFAFLRRRHAERGRGMPRPYEERLLVGATHGSPFIHRRRAERGRGMPRPYDAERALGAPILNVGFSGR